jgi:hypothetical protein
MCGAQQFAGSAALPHFFRRTRIAKTPIRGLIRSMAHLDTLPLTSVSSPRSSSQPARLWVEVRRGRTRAPRRAVKSERFLIGAGSNCQLQLGGDDIPILHSILLVNEEGAHIDAVVPWPQLIVNGTPQRTADLHDGDQFTIGKFEFAVHEQRPAAAGQALAMTPAVDLPDVPESEDLASLSVAAIVERIERDQRQVQQFETARESGALALLQAAKQAARDREGDSPVSADELLRELQDLSRELDRRARLLAQREAECAERAANLLKVHDEISDQMEQIGARLSGEPEVPYLQRQAS